MAVPDRRILPWWRTPRLALWLILAGALAYGITAGAGYRGLRDMAWHSAALRHDEETLSLIERTLGLLLDIETGQRGYMLSGSLDSLEPYERGKARLPTVYAELMHHLASEAVASEDFAVERQRLDLLVKHRVAIADAHVERRRTEPAELASTTVTAGTDLDGKAAMDAIRHELEALSAVHQAHVAQRDASASRLLVHTIALIAGLTAGGTSLMVGAVWLLVGERRRRDNAEASLRRFSHMLESMIDDRTEEVRAARDRLQSFAKQLDDSIEAERRRLAREVHDQFGQIATGTKLVVQQLARDHPELPPEKVAMLTGLLDESITMARRIATELRPPLLDDLGFAAAVSHFAGRLSQPGRIEIEPHIDDDEQLGSDQANQLFRIVQEATTNALRHAQATHVKVTGCVFRGQYVLRVADNGIGPQPVRADASGLRNMRERASLVGGSFDFGPGERVGSEVVARIPIVPPSTASIASEEHAA